MRLLSMSSSDRSKHRQRIFVSLMTEIQESVPVSRLTEKLKKDLEQLPRDERRAICSELVDGCSPFFVACKNGSADIVEYMITTCSAEIEQRGLYEVLEEGISHHVTPLWCAAVSGRLSVVRVLIRHGADVNAVSDSGSTAIRSACYIVRNGLDTSHFEIIKCLVRAGADIQRPNHFGGTCLINSVQSPQLVKFLIENGVNINAEDIQHKSALHYAVQENRLETLKLLIKHGGDPFKKSKNGDDILQTACLKGSLVMFNYLIESVDYDLHRIADAYELLGTTFLLDLHDVVSTLLFWRKALTIRNDGKIQKCPKKGVQYHAALDTIELDSEEELDLVCTNVDSLKRQALLITERILGTDHKDTIFRFMFAGAALADANEYKSCISLWNYALKLKVRKETLVSCDTSFTAKAIVNMYINILSRESIDDNVIEFDDVLTTMEYMNTGMVEAMSLLAVDPVCRAQLETFDIVLTTWVHLALILLRVAKTEEDMKMAYASISPILVLNPITQFGDSILHLAVSSSSTLKALSLLDEDSYPLFPSPRLVEFILDCGFDVHTRNFIDETAVHVASKMDNFDTSVIQLLLDKGHGHLDTPDSRGICPVDILHTHTNNINAMKYVSLKCLAARVVMRERINLEGVELIPNMATFMLMHM